MSKRPGLKILLIDDSAVVRRVLKQLLRRYARIQQIFEASEAAEGYSLFKVSRPDAVVLDLDLPDLHGLEILKMIKNAAPFCVVIILASSDAPEMRDVCLRHGADSFLSKESDLFRVASAIFDLCRSARSRARSGTIKERGSR
jgi:DNA-binding NarL/FixJ family response regulator